MAKKKVTSNDVAKLAGVSQPTVSMILNNNYKSFTPETVKRVLDACNQLNYQIPVSKKYNQAIASKLLLAILPSYSNLHYVRLIEAMQIRAMERGYSLMNFASFRDPAVEAQFTQIVSHLPVVGAFFLYLPENQVGLTQVASQIPVVSIYDKADTNNMDIIELDSSKLGKIIARHLLDLGHTKIAYISTPFGKHQLARIRRLEGMRIIFEEAGISTDNIITCTLESEQIPHAADISEYEIGYRLAERVIEKYDITALVGVNDMVAVGIMDALIDKKLRIPQDYSVCGCDNTSIANYRRISLTSVEHFSTQRGREAVDILIRKIEQGSVPGHNEDPISFIRVEYAPKLIARTSTGVNRQNN